MIVSKIKRIMEEKGVTLKQITDETGLAEITLIRARGEQILQCRLATLETIAHFLGCKTKDLYDED